MDSHLTSLLCTIVILPSLYAIPEIEVLHRLEPLHERFVSRVVRQSDIACCGSVPFKTEVITELFGECKEEIGDLEKKDELPCMFECAGKKLEVVDSKGQIKVQKFVKLCQRMAEGDETLQEHVRSVCSTYAENMKEVPEDTQRKFKCRLDMGLAFIQAHFEIILECPSDMMNNDPECEKIRDDMRNKLKRAEIEEGQAQG